MRSCWCRTNLDGLLGQLCNFPNAEAVVLLRPALRIPEGYTIQGQNRAMTNPWLCVTVIHTLCPRKVEWEIGKFAYIKKTPQAHGTEKLTFDPVRLITKKYKSVVTVSKIIVLIQTKDTGGKPESPRAGCVKQGYMGAEMGKEGMRERGKDRTVDPSRARDKTAPRS